VGNHDHELDSRCHKIQLTNKSRIICVWEIKVVRRPVMMTDQVIRKKDEVDEPYRKNRMLTTNAEAL